MKIKPFKSKPFGKQQKKEEIIKYTSDSVNIEKDSIDELNYIKKEFKIQKNKEVKSINEQIDMNYYFCVYFKNKEQKEQFINLINSNDIFDLGKKFVSGEQLADKLSIPLTKIIIKSKGFFKQAKRFIHDEWF